MSRKLGEVRTQMDNLKQRNFTQRGSLNQIDSNIDRNKKELGAKQYHNIDQDYKDKQIELRCTEMANRDLDKYYQVGVPFPLYSNISFEKRRTKSPNFVEIVFSSILRLFAFFYVFFKRLVI